MAASKPSIKISKSIAYRGGTRVWSNRYYFDGGTPADLTHWTTLSGNVVAQEKNGATDNVSFVSWQGYAAGSDVPVASGTLTGAGLVVHGAQSLAPGDCAVLVRWATNARTRKNHPLYLFNYYHGVVTSGPGTPDTAWSSMVSNLQSYVNHWITGFSDGTINVVRCGPNGQLATAALVETTVTHRDFPRA